MKDYSNILNNYKPKRMNRFNAFVVRTGTAIFCKDKDIKYNYELDLKEYKNKQVCLISDHASRNNFYIVLNGYPNKRLNPVIGYVNFFDKRVFSILRMAGAIPKYNGTHDLKSVKNILNLVSNKASILLFPEGANSAFGITQPTSLATIKLFKKMNVDVVLAKTKGAYLSNPIFQMRSFKKGPIEVTYKVLFKKEEINTLSIEEMYQRYLKEFSYNDFKWNESKQYSYISIDGNAKGFDTLLYKCPSCYSEGNIKVKNDSIICGSCGLDIKIDSKYNMIPSKEININRLDKWYLFEREEVKKEIIKNDFYNEYNVDYCELNSNHLNKLSTQADTCEKIGEGKLIFSFDNFKYIGLINNVEVEKTYDYKVIQNAIFIPGNGLQIYDNRTINEFIFKDNTSFVSKALMIIQEMHNLYDIESNKCYKDVYK